MMVILCYSFFVMAKMVLVHGFGIGITAPFFRPGFGNHAGFAAFKKLIACGEAVVFSWGIKKPVGLWQILNPFFWRGIYEKEKILSQVVTTHQQFCEFLFHEQPEIIVAHSMGCYLLNEYLNKNFLPPSVKKIVFVQADLSNKIKLNFSLPILNLYCPWDPTLWLSVLYNRAWRGGLSPINNSLVKNVFLPLWRLPNLHNGILRTRHLKKIVLDLF